MRAQRAPSHPALPLATHLLHQLGELAHALRMQLLGCLGGRLLQVSRLCHLLQQRGLLPQLHVAALQLMRQLGHLRGGVAQSSAGSGRMVSSWTQEQQPREPMQDSDVMRAHCTQPHRPCCPLRPPAPPGWCAPAAAPPAPAPAAAAAPAPPTAAAPLPELWQPLRPYAQQPRAPQQLLPAEPPGVQSPPALRQHRGPARQEGSQSLRCCGSAYKHF